MQLAGKLGQSPRQTAEAIAARLSDESIKDIQIAGPGFINLTLSDSALWQQANLRKTDVYQGNNFVIEYSCPNYFKELHAGHLYQTIVGDVIARMVEQSGATVHRTNFGGDVGQHVARAMWGILKNLPGEDAAKLDDIDSSVMGRAAFISRCYVEGSAAFASDQSAKAEIEVLNKRIYGLHKDEEPESDFAKIYFTVREWSREYFIELYKQLQVAAFERYYPESATEGRGMAEVRERIGTVFAESDGAVVVKGEDYGLHTRVFITKEQLPTYETKDVGLVLMEQDEFGFDHRILITGREQTDYMKVVWKALEQIRPGLESKMTHLVNGIIKFGDGKKMSSRTGNVTTAVDVLNAVRSAVGKSADAVRNEQIALGAVKYEFLKHRLGGDIAFDPNESVSLQGNSGPYLQYALVRATGILRQSAKEGIEPGDFDENERLLVRKLAEYQSVLAEATRGFQPHLLCNYLYNLAGQFNRFYEKCPVVGDQREDLRMAIVQAYAGTLQAGLELLGIKAPDKM